MALFGFLPGYLVLAITIIIIAAGVAWMHFYSRDLIENHIGGDSPKAIFLCALGGSLPSCGGIIAVVSLFKRGSLHIKSLTAAAIAALGDSGFVLWSTVVTLGTISLWTALKLHALLFILGILSAYLILPFGRIIDKPVHCLAVLIEKGFGWLAGKINLVKSKLGLSAEQKRASVCELESETARRAVWGELRATLGILFWIFIVFFVVSLLQTYFRLDIKNFNYIYGFWGVLFGAALGAIPSCGLQISVITLWATGIIPTEMFIANIIAQDGDGFWILWFANPIIALKIKLLMVLEGVAVGTAYSYIY